MTCLNYNIITTVSLQIAAHQTEGYTIQTELYEGPLDLLLDLIDRAELDITRLALAQVTDQYLAYLRNLTNRDPAEVSAFLVIAARLVQIKSAALLPRPPIIETSTDEPDPGEALAQQLILYRRFKQLGGWIEARQNAGLRTYLRLAPPDVRADARLDLSGLTLHDLVRSAWSILAEKNSLPALSQVVNLPRVTIRERIQNILTILRKNGQSNFRRLLDGNSRLEIVVTFLAMLELVKRHVIAARQEQLFDDIQLVPESSLEDVSSDEVEFTE